jgi:hypothetical protein
METRIIKIDNIMYLNAEIDMFHNAGYQVCKRNEKPCLKIIFKESASYNRRQKTVYFKRN